MQLKLQKSASAKKALYKDLTDVKTVNVILKDQCSITDPVFVLSSVTAAEIAGINYCSCEVLGRSYFITGIDSVRNGVFEISAHVDVLSTYASQILEQTAIIHRQENDWNLYLDDGIFKTYQNPNIVVKNFPSGFSSQSFVLAVAGD